MFRRDIHKTVAILDVLNTIGSIGIVIGLPIYGFIGFGLWGLLFIPAGFLAGFISFHVSNALICVVEDVSSIRYKLHRIVKQLSNEEESIKK